MKNSLLLLLLLTVLSGCANAEFKQAIKQLEQAGYTCSKDVSEEEIELAEKMGIEKPTSSCFYQETSDEVVWLSTIIPGQGQATTTISVFFSGNDFIGQYLAIDEVDGNLDNRIFYDFGKIDQETERYDELCILQLDDTAEGVSEKDCQEWISGEFQSDVFPNKQSTKLFINHYDLMESLYPEINIKMNFKEING